MSTFTLAFSCLTTSYLPWWQVPMHYCSVQHCTLILSPVTSTAGYCFRFGSISSFFLKLFLHWSSVACWAPTHLGNSSFSIVSFCLFILFMGFSRQEYWVEYYSAIKRNAFESVLMMWVKLEPIIQSEVSQKEKHQYSILTHIYGI